MRHWWTLGGLTLAISLALAVAGPAAAGLHNALPADADENPADVFNDNDALFAYTTSDFTGGYVCILHAEAPADRTCDGPAWGDKNRVVGIGSQFTLIEFGDLLPGHWRLQTVDSEGKNGEAGGEFTVVPCPGCDNSISAAAAAQAKASAQGLGRPLALACLGFAVKELDGSTSEAARSTLKAFHLARHPNFSNARGFVASVAPGIGGALGLSFEIPTLSNPGEEKAMEILKDLVCSLTQMYSDIAADPPDPAFTTVATPTFATLPTDSDAVSGALMEALDSQTAYGETMLKGYERYQGAVAAGSGAAPYVHAQAGAVGRFGQQQVAEMREATVALRAKAAALDGLPAFAGPVVTAQRRDDLATVYARVRTTGFTIDELAQLTSLGLASAEIDDARSQFTPDPSILPLDTTLQSILRDAADALEGAVPDMEAFVRSAGVVAGRTNIAPTASYTATPLSGPAPLTVSFVSTSTSEDLDELTYEWDFGDGTTATGPSVSHAYATQGIYVSSLTVSDGLASATSSKNISVGVEPPVNAAPVAVPDSLTTAVDTAGTVNVLLNDTDADGDVLTVTGSTSAAHGLVSCLFDGACTYTPTGGYEGPDSFSYTVSDGNGGTAIGNVSVTVTAAPNNPPVAQPDELTTTTAAAASVSVLLNDSDPDGEPLAVIDSTDGTHGLVSCTPVGLCTYTPTTAGYVGQDVFSYTISDGRAGTAQGSVFVTIAETPNTPPVAVDDALATDRNTAGTLDVLANDTDVDGDPLSVATEGVFGAHGFATCDQVAGTCTYTPRLGYTGADSFEYTIVDGRGGLDVATVFVTVADPPNRPPLAADDVLVSERDSFGSVAPLENDADPDLDPLELVSWTEPAHGTVFCLSATCFYTPEPGYFGPDAFTYTVSDGRGGSAAATVAVTVDGNRTPIAQPDSLTVAEGEPNTVNVVANDFDADGDVLSVQSWTEPDHGELNCTLGGICMFTPDAGFLGTDGFVYTVRDPGGKVSTATVSVTVVDPLIAGDDWVWRRNRALAFEAAIVDPTGATHTCTWTFGDGTPASNGCAFDHTYAAVGKFEAVLEVEFTGGLTVSETVEVTVIPPESGGSSGGETGGGVTVPGTDVAYTTDADFDQGTLLNVNHEAPNANRLQLNTRTTPFPFVNIAASARGTIVRIDVETGEVLGEYLTAPDGMGRNPSRTTVDQLGNAWVANRNEGGESDGRLRGSVARVGLVLGGTRVDAAGAPDPGGDYLEPPFKYNTCVDRDGDGVLFTSRGLADIRPWTNADGNDTNGGVTTAADECVINYTRVTGTGTRTIAVDANNDVWVGGQGNQDFEKLDGSTGQPIPGTQFNLGCGGYGGLIDGNGVLWGAQQLLRYDTAAGAGECLQTFGYGLGIDPQTNHIWMSGGGIVHEFDEDGTPIGGPRDHGFGSSQGIAVDGSGSVWVAHSLGGQSVGRVRTDGTLVGVVPTAPGPTGVAVDANGKVWVANISGSAQRIDPAIGRVGPTGGPSGWVDLTVDLGFDSGPYNYSDMTGFVSVGATARSGFWRVVQDAGSAGANWGTITWNAEGGGAGGGAIEVEARAADTAAALVDEPFVAVENGNGFNLDGRLIELRASLRAGATGPGPVLTDLRIKTRVDNSAPVASNVAASVDRDVATPIALVASDQDGDALTYEIVAPPAHGALSGTGASRTYTPSLGYTGPDSFTYRVSDGTLVSSIATVAITVVPRNRAPVAADVTVSTLQGTAKSIALQASDPDGDPLTYEVVGGPGHGTLGPIVGGEVTYTPAAGYSGPDWFTYRVTDGALQSSVATVSISVVEVINEAPDAVDDVLAVLEDGSGSVGVLANDMDTESDSLTVTSSSDGTHGDVTCTPAGSCSYTPAANFNGSDLFSYSVSDGHGNADTATVRVTVSAVNDVPACSSRFFATAEDTLLTASVSCSDADGDSLTYAKVAGPSHGSATLEPDGDFTYAPAAGYSGPDAFTFRASDGSAQSNVATASITVTGVNDAPVASDDAATTNEDTQVAVTLAATDPDGDALTYSIAAGPSHGTLAGAGNSRTYTPAANYHGPDSFDFVVSDGNGGSDVATVTITVRSVNDPPDVVDRSINVDEDGSIAVALGGADPDGDSLTITHASPGHGAYDGTAYTPASGYAGPDSFTYTASDGNGGTDTATVTITVRPGNDAPDVIDRAAATDEDVPLAITLTGTDPDGDALTISTTGPSHGTYAAGVYTPAANYHGPDSFSYTADDGNGGTDTATVSITVRSVNDAPLAGDQNVATDEDMSLPITLGANDVDGGDLVFALATAPQHGTWDGTRYTPAANYHGPDSFDFLVSDGNGGSDLGTVSITVRPVNDAPSVDDHAVATDEDSPLPIALSGTDADADTLTITTSSPSHGTYVSGIYTPAANYHGQDSFTYTAVDGRGGTDTATVSVTVRPVNDAPNVNDLSVTTVQDTPLTMSLSGTDVDGDTLAITYTAPGNGAFDGTRYTPAAGYHGPDSFSYTAADGQGGSDTATVSITVTPSSPTADTTPPSCAIVEQGKTAAGNAFIRFRVDEVGLGLARHELGYTLNTNIVVEPYAVGSLGPVTVTATAINKRKSMAVEVFFYDLAGNRTLCDPIVLSVLREDEQPQDETFHNVAAADNRVTIYNGNPGLRKVVLLVNGTKFKEVELKPNEVRKFNIASAMKPGYTNTITIRARGKKGASALIVIADIP